MGLKLYTGRSICKKISVPHTGQSQQFFLRQKSIPEQELKQVKIGLKMQGGSYMFINRIGSYHSNLSLQTFFNVRLIQTVENLSCTSGSDMPIVHAVTQEELLAGAADEEVDQDDY